MLKHKLLTMAVVLVACAAGADARTWYVEKDGSGDYTVIQDAVDAAEPGDTILVGPGHYDEVRPVPFWSGRDAVVAINKSGLEIRGAGVDQTIIGADFYSMNLRTIIAYDPAWLDGLTIADATILGGWIAMSIWYVNSVHVEGCEFRDSQSGIHLAYGSDNIIRGCQFRDLVSTGVRVSGLGASNTLIEDCQFSGMIQGVSISRIHDAVVTDCTMTDVRVPIQFDVGARGEITNLYATGRDGDQYGVGVSLVGIGTRATLVDCVIDWSMTSTAALSVGDAATVSGHGNVLRGGDLFTINLLGPQAVDGFHHNEIYREGGFAVRARYWGDPTQRPAHVDMTNNYWGTDDPELIAAWIEDYHDHPGQPHWCMVVDFIPFVSGPVPVQQQTWTDVKNLFRD
jgi:hypothetical protein